MTADPRDVIARFAYTVHREAVRGATDPWEDLSDERRAPWRERAALLPANPRDLLTSEEHAHLDADLAEIARNRHRTPEDDPHAMRADIHEQQEEITRLRDDLAEQRRLVAAMSPHATVARALRWVLGHRHGGIEVWSGGEWEWSRDDQGGNSTTETPGFDGLVASICEAMEESDG